VGTGRISSYFRSRCHKDHAALILKILKICDCFSGGFSIYSSAIGCIAGTRVPAIEKELHMGIRFLVGNLVVALLFCSTALYATGNDADETEPSSSSAQTENNPQKKPWPDKIGPFEIQSPDKRNSLRFSFAMEVLFRGDSIDNGSGADRTNDFYGEARRIRPTLSGTLADGTFDFYLQLNTTANNAELLDYYVTYKSHPYAQVRVGQWKIPFGYYRNQSFRNLTLSDWAITTKYFGAERQFGITLQSDLEKPRKLDYSFGVFSGVNARASHALGMALLYGEKVVSASNLSQPGPRMDFHPEMVARIGYNHNGIDTARDTDFKRGPAGFHAGISGTYDLDAQSQLEFVARLSPEILFKGRGFSAFLAYQIGWGDRFTVDRPPEVAMTGLLAQASYLVTKRLELAARYAMANNSQKFREDARMRADALIAAAKDPAEAAALTAQYKKVGTVIRENETTLGLNIYIIGESLKLQNDVSFLLHQYVGQNRDDIRVRSQLLLAF
jgi:hypothetical protein